MTQLTTAGGVEVADLTIPEGCMICGGDLEVRMSPEGARAVCVKCHWLTKPTISVTQQGLAVRYEVGLA